MTLWATSAAGTVHDMEPVDVAALDDRQLAELAAAAQAEQRRRAVEEGDAAAVADAAFAGAFDGSGVARNPSIVNGLLVCPGSLVGSSKPGGSHDCVFVFATEAGDEGAWVFEHRERAADLIRHTSIRGRDVQQSVTVLPATEGLTVQRIVSKARGGRHERQSVTAWKVTGGALVSAHPDPVNTTNSR